MLESLLGTRTKILSPFSYYYIEKHKILYEPVMTPLLQSKKVYECFYIVDEKVGKSNENRNR